MSQIRILYFVAHRVVSINEHKLAPALKDEVLFLSFVLAAGAEWPGSEWVQLRANPVNKKRGKKSNPNSINSIPRSVPSIWLTYIQIFALAECDVQDWKKQASGGRVADC